MKFKRGFSLTEVFLVMAVISLMLAMSLNIMAKQKSSLDLIAYQVYESLSAFVKYAGSHSANASLESYTCMNAKTETAYKACMSAGAKSTEHSDLVDFTNDTDFCQFMADAYSSNGVDCSSLNNASLSKPYGSITSGINPNFSLPSGVDIYVSSRIKESDFTGYRIITVDLNGSDKPDKLGLDRISFVIFDYSSEVLLLGAPSKNTDLFKAAVRKYKKNPSAEDVKNSVLVSKNASGSPLSFKEAYCSARGNHEIYTGYCKNYIVDSDCPDTSTYFCEFYVPRPSKNILFMPSVGHEFQKYKGEDGKNVYLYKY